RFANVETDKFCAAVLPRILNQPRHTAAVGRNPQPPLPVFRYVIDKDKRQAIAPVVIDEVGAVKATQPLPGSKPEKAFTVLTNRNNGTVRQAIGNSIGFEGQLLGLGGASQQNNQADNREVETRQGFRRL